MYPRSLHYNMVPRRKLLVLYFYGNYFRNPWKFSLKILLSHVFEARIIETMGKKREKYEILSELCFDWSKQVTCFSQRFKHYSVYSAGLASRVPIEQLHPSLFTWTRARQFLWKIGTKCARVSSGIWIGSGKAKCERSKFIGQCNLRYETKIEKNKYVKIGIQCIDVCHLAYRTNYVNL